MTTITQEARDIADRAVRLNNDVYGNPRFYLSVTDFWDNGGMYRPAFANKYRGKKYGAGWVFQSYYLADDVQGALNARAACLASEEKHRAKWSADVKANLNL